MSTNDITGDRLVSKATNDAYAEGHERIWGKSRVESVEYRAEQTEKNARLRAVLDASPLAQKDEHRAHLIDETTAIPSLATGCEHDWCSDGDPGPGELMTLTCSRCGKETRATPIAE